MIDLSKYKFVTREEFDPFIEKVEYYAAVRNPSTGEVYDYEGHSHFAVVIFHKLLGQGTRNWMDN